MQARTPRLGFAPALLVSSLTGLLFALGAPPGGWVVVYPAALLPLLWIVRHADWTPGQTVLLGLAGGIGIGLGGFPWIAEMLVKFARVPWVLGYAGLVFFSLWMAIPYALFALGLRFGQRVGWPGFVWPILLFVSLQSLWPNLFPYTPLLGLAEHPEWMQLAELVGVHGIEALAVTSALLLERAASAGPPKGRAAALLVALLIPPLLFGYGLWRMDVMDARAEGAPEIRVGIVQPNVPVGRVPPAQKLDRLRLPSAKLARESVDVVIWPEAGAYPYGTYRPFRHDRELAGGRVLAHHSSPTIFGLNTRHRDDRFGYNSVFLLEPSGAVAAGYDKINLVPFGESIPIIDPTWLTDRIPEIGHHNRGEEMARFVIRIDRPGEPARTASAGPLICYEDIIPSFVRRVAAQPGGLELFVNVTIDAWYGDSAEPWEHLALAQFRSVEHRVPLVRSVSTGVSAVVDYNGRLVAHAPLRPVSKDTLDRYPPETLRHDLRLPRNTEADPTVYARFGWLFPHACQLGVLVFGVLGWRGRRRVD